MIGFVGLAVVPRPQPDQYVGSKACQSCHRDVFEQHADSQHQRMMRPVSQPGVVVADFETHAEQLPFRQEDAVWAIGGKWEQQFMGHDGEAETLLPGEWLGGVQKWDLSGWDGWERPVPLERCHGCHTVGLDVKTGTFVEANIGCESCHGPSAWHVKTWGIGRIYSGVESEICGQCHTRGMEPSGKYYFPISYRPGEQTNLTEVFRFNAPTLGQESSHWWANGHARERHQEFSAWSQGGHANALKSLLSPTYDGRFGAVNDECLRCHAAESILSEREKPTLEGVSNGVTCAVCHESHGPLDRTRTECVECHETGASYHRPESNTDHVPCPPAAKVGCVDCHMPATAKVGGKYQLHSHSPGFVVPTALSDEAAATGCTNDACHVGVDRAEMQNKFDDHYGHKGMRAAKPSSGSLMPH